MHDMDELAKVVDGGFARAMWCGDGGCAARVRGGAPGAAGGAWGRLAPTRPQQNSPNLSAGGRAVSFCLHGDDLARLGHGLHNVIHVADGAALQLVGQPVEI